MTEAYGATDDGPAPLLDGGGLDPVLRRVIEAADLAIATLDPEGHVVGASSAFAAHWGRSVDEVVGLHLVGLWPERQRAEVTATLVRLVEGACELEIVDARAIAEDGRMRVVRMTFGRRPDAEGRTASVVCALTDVSDVHRGLRRGSAAVELVRPVSRNEIGEVPGGDGALVPLLASAVRRAARTGRPLSLLVCEISGLDAALVDPATDRAELLEVCSERLAGRLRPSDAVFRSAEDTYAVIAEDLGDEQDAAGVAYRLLSSAIEPISSRGAELAIGMTIGLVVADGAASPERMLEAAASALDAARGDGVGGFRIVDIRSGLAA